MDDNNIQNEKDIIDLGKVFKTLWEKRKTFYIVLPIVFVLSCIWIFPQPRYYTCEVKLAPEGGEDAAGGLASVASSFGFNIGEGGSVDAIYPSLYPELFQSPEFLAGLFDITVITGDGTRTLKTDYYTYLLKHQKENWLTKPFISAKKNLSQLLSSKPLPTPRKQGEKFNPFKMSEKDYELIKKMEDNIYCSVDKKNDVITIVASDQDPLVCALLADSIKEKLQDFIIEYRTKKAKQDVAYYQHLTDSSKVEYEKSMQAYSSYSDSHRNTTLKTYVELGEKLRNDMSMKLTTYNTFSAQLSAAKAKIQERTPSFTTLKSATVPLNPDGPKHVRFVLGVMLFTTMIMSVWMTRKELKKLFV